MKRVWRWLGIFASTLMHGTACGSAATPAASHAHRTPIEIGWLGGLTGPLAADTAAAKAGTEMAVAKVNGSGGVLGRSVKVVYENTGMDPQKARQAVQSLVLSDHVAGIIGDYFSPNTIAILPLIAKYHTPTVSYLSQADRITQSGNKYIFVALPPSLISAKAIALYAMNELHERRFVLFGGTDSYSAANLRDFAQVVRQHGGQVVGTERYGLTTKDFSPYLLKYAHVPFDALFLGGQPPSNALIAKQARAVGMKEQILGTTGLDRKIIWQGAGAAIVGADLSLEVPGAATNGRQYMNPKAVAFQKAWLAAGHSLPSILAAAHAYDATMLLLKAIRAAKSTQGPKVRSAMLTVGRNYQGVADTFTMEPDGSPRMPMYIAQWQANGSLDIVASTSMSELYGK